MKVKQNQLTGSHWGFLVYPPHRLKCHTLTPKKKAAGQRKVWKSSANPSNEFGGFVDVCWCLVVSNIIQLITPPAAPAPGFPGFHESTAGLECNCWCCWLHCDWSLDLDANHEFCSWVDPWEQTDGAQLWAAARHKLSSNANPGTQGAFKPRQAPKLLDVPR